MSTNPTPANLVFKVKCGDDLKRINESVNGEPLSSDLGLLKSRIRECFTITSDKDFDLTYIDVDGDTVMLADDSDLYDVTVKQGLNPVRVNVELIHNKNKLNSGKKHAAAPTEVKTDVKAEPGYPAGYLVGAADTAPNGISAKPARAEPESSCGQTIVHEVIKCHGCGKFTPKELWNGDYSNTCAKCAPPGIRTDPRSFWRGMPTDKVPTRTSLNPAPVEACNSFRSYWATGAPFSPVDAKNSVDFGGYGSRPRGSRGSFPITSRDDIDCRELSRKYVFSSLKAQVEEVTFPFGSTLAPNTSFTKIWRVWNSDSVTWPCGVQIKNVSASPGFAVVVCAQLEIPACGLGADEGVDISMDLRTPSNPGTYYATWSLVPPPGFYFKHKQQISVSITVSAELGSAHNASVDKVKSRTLDNPVKTEANGKSGITIFVPTKRVPVPEGVKGRRCLNSASVARVGSGKGKAVAAGGDGLEESMMKELYEMGFCDKDMNLEFLKSSNYNLGLVLDRLCDMSMNEEEDDDVDGDDDDDMWIEG